ncbi:T9SS type A sorting domain-containing protein [Tamlana sp. 2_MG-2023]|uniref:T9SS type A sorting domain-containing protein n=1 Tax=unclassified Tamlana TaxID=2614803 RepID=UPI0026E3D1EA|nr:MULTISPECIES: T9SS type A sorting domain-containing protein [unclassified Tamlana]MDO6758867.1 T9SS type A sorting domain-containing protein [Tamlana sp. 2_MG-2023]MDO6789566.1 T9SS type A sorting domain-containing protein [Tamlana sp. 1_MG-2023]
MSCPKNLLPLLVCFAFFLNVNSQTGPGGVGDGAANLMLWLRADAGVESSTGVDALNGENVSSWLDQSGDNNDAISVNAPSYETAQHNGYPAVHFTSVTSEYMNISDHSNLPSGSKDRTYIFVGEGSNSGSQNLLYHGNDVNDISTSGQRINLTNNTNEISVAVNGQRYGRTLPSSTALRVGAVVFPIGGSSSNEFVFYNNGGLVIPASLAGVTRTVNTNNIVAWLGANRVPSNYYNGDMCEIIVFDREINEAEFIIINNYVSAKYGTTLTDNDLYTQDDAANGNCDHNVAGIGRVDGSNLHTDSQGTGIVRINNASALSNGDYLFWGENTKDYSFSTNTSTYKEQLNSIWGVNKIGDLGTVTVTLDLSGIDLSGKQSCQNLEFVIDDDIDFSSPTTVYDLGSSPGTTVTITGVDFSNGDYFTLRYLDQIVWDGTSFFNGSGAGNVPNNTTDQCLKLTVKSGAPGTLSSHAYVREVEVESGGTLHVADGELLEVDNQVVVDGVIDLLGEAQLIQNHSSTTSNSGAGVLVKRQQGTNNLFSYNYWSAPVNTGGAWQIENLEDATGVINFSSSHDADASTSPITLSTRWLYKYNGLINTYTAWQKITATTSLFPGIGYSMKGSGTSDPEQEYVFKGTPNDGNYSISVTAGNEILIGNPYSSALNANQFIADNTSVIEGTLYFWEQATTNNSHYLVKYIGGYATYNSLMGTAAATADMSGLTSGTSFAAKGAPTGNIAVAQGFFVPIDNTGNIVFNNQQRIFAKESDASDAPIFYKNTNSKSAKTSNSTDLRPKMWLSFTDPNHFQSFLGLGYDSENGTTGYDKGYDGKLYEEKDNEMYWVLNDEKLVIQALSNINIEDELPVTIKVTDGGLYKFAISKMENVPEDLNVFLKDNYTNSYYNLKDETAELFLQKNSYEDQYVIAFQENNSLATEEYENQNLSVFYDTKTKDLVINNTNVLNDVQSISIYNSVGQEVLKLKTFDSNRIDISKFNDGFYILNVNTKNNKNTAKFLKY